MAENVERNLRLLQELISCCSDIYLWSFDSRLALIYTNAPYKQGIETLFELTGSSMDKIGRWMDAGRPVVLSDALGLLWIADFERDMANTLLYTHVIGPVFLESASIPDMERELRHLSLSYMQRAELLCFLQDLPVISITRFYDYGLMLHYCITGEKIGFDEFQYPEGLKESKKKSSVPYKSNYQMTWALEQELLRAVEQGNLDYKKRNYRRPGALEYQSIGNGNSIRQIKNLVLVFTALCARAAIRGGLTPEIAYALSDKYIVGIEACTSIGKIVEINAAMQDDYISRVHQCKVLVGASPQILICCNYIQMHLAEKISIPDLAAKMGYSKSYLSKLFKQEKGMTINEYIMQQRIEQAKDRLRMTGDSIQDICAQLGFGSQSYFGKHFRQATGMTPGEYRATQGQSHKG